MIERGRGSEREGVRESVSELESGSELGRERESRLSMKKKKHSKYVFEHRYFFSFVNRARLSFT